MDGILPCPRGIAGAQTHAEKEESDVIDCHYLVLGLLDSDEDLQRYLADVEFDSISGPKTEKGEDQFVFQLEAKKAIEFAFEEARLRESSTIDTTHMFCGVLRTDSETRRSLNRQGINLEGYRTRLGWE